MRVLITGICGFVGHQLAKHLREARDRQALDIVGIDNLSRQGSETNRSALAGLGVRFLHGDIRLQSDVTAAGPVDWIIDAAANPSVLAGIDGRTSARQLIEHNLIGTVNLLEHCRSCSAGFLLLSTSRVYSIPPLQALSLETVDDAFRPAAGVAVDGITAEGVTETFSTAPPLSLYGATKAASEMLALEYHHSLGVPVWIDRCGVLGGAGQFGHAAQGIFTYWIHAHRRRLPLRYIGFAGTGRQVRDCLHPRDLAALVLRQLEHDGGGDSERTFNVAGGPRNSMSLAQLTRWCDDRFGRRPVEADPAPRAFDVPWLVLDSTRARETWGWSADTDIESILDEIAEHAAAHPDWLEISGGIQ